MVSVILLMAGKGTRMKENINKVLLPKGYICVKIYMAPINIIGKIKANI